MFGIGMPELVVVLVVALVVLGPSRLPELARTLGKALSEFRRQTNEVMEEFEVQALLDDDRPRTTPAPATPPAATPPAGTAPQGGADAPPSTPGSDRPA
jgi:Tat protein translocase TatB subunit